MLDKEFQYYLDHQSDLVKKYDKKYIVIKDNDVVGVFDTKDEAYFDSIKKFGLGEFLMQYCAPGTMFYTQTFYTQNAAF